MISDADDVVIGPGGLGATTAFYLAKRSMAISSLLFQLGLMHSEIPIPK